MTRRIAIGTVVIAVVMLVIGLMGVAYINRVLRTRAQAELFRQAEATGRLVEDALGNVGVDLDAGFEGRIRAVGAEAARVLERARIVGGHDIVEAEVVVRDRSFPLSRRQDLMPLLPPNLEEREALTIDVDGAEVLATVQRVPLGPGEIVIAIGRTAPLLPVREMSRALLLAVVVGVIMIFVFGSAMAQWVRRRLAGLESASRAIAGGDLTARAPADVDDEIGTVAVAFNEMAENLEVTRRREREFLMSIGHDLRTPLTTIRGYAEALDEGTIDRDDTARVAKVLHAQTDRLARLVEDVMLLGRIEAREFTLRPEEVDVAAHLSGVVDSFRKRADEIGIAIDFESHGAGTANLDPDRLAQVCGNLVENALRYTPVHGTVTVAVATSGGRVTLEVADTGPGIDPADADRVFDRLYVARRYHPIRPEGSGLGLTIVRELVGAMGGTVGIERAPTTGSRFIVTLPA